MEFPQLPALGPLDSGGAEFFGDRLLSTLPAPSRAKVERLVADRDAAYAAYRAASDREQEARTTWQRRDILVRRQLADAPQIAHDWNTPPDERRLIEQERAGNIMASATPSKREHDAALAARDRAADAMNRFAFLDPMQRWLVLAVSRGVRLNHRPLPPVKASVKAALPQEVERIRQQLAELDAAWAAAEGAPDTRDSYRQRAIAEIEALAARGALAVDLRRRGQSPLALASHLSLTLQMFPGPSDQGGTIYRLAGDPAQFFCWLNRDAIMARVNDLIDAADDTGAMSHDTREKKFAQISAQRLELEFAEESAISAAENAGMQIARRRAADPRAILEVSEV